MNNSEFTPYQYSIIRYHHDATTHEFLNIGVALFAPAFKYFRTSISQLYSRITDTFYGANGDEYRNQVNRLTRRFDKLSSDVKEAKPELIPSYPENIEALLRNFLRKESSFRYSNPASGIAPASIEGLNETFERLLFDYVQRYIPRHETDSRTEDQVWRGVYRPKIENLEKGILERLQPKKIITPIDNLEYDYSWKNGRWHLIQPISFDLMKPGSIIEKAHRNLGKNVLLNTSDEISHLYLLLGQPKNKDEVVNESYNRAKDIVRANGFHYDIKLVEENEAEDFAIYLSEKIDSSS